MTDNELAEEYVRNKADKGNFDVEQFGRAYFSESSTKQAFLAGLNAGRPEWHKLDWKKDYPKLDRLVRVRTKCGEEYICDTYAYQPTEDEIGYGTILTQFEELNGDWVDDNEIEYWCYIEPFKE